MLKLAWQFSFEYSRSGSNVFINRGSINEKHCSAEKASRELLSIMSRDNTEKPQALSQRNKREEKKNPLAFLPSACLIPIPA